MAEVTLTELEMRAGVWHGRLTGAQAAPDVEVTHLGVALNGVELRDEGTGSFVLSVPVPADTLGDGVQTYLISDRKSGVRLGSFAIVAGRPLEADLRAELDLIRAELDMLKSAFRRLAANRG
jgi:hypothetical protein